jgi:hypothetical protein
MGSLEKSIAAIAVESLDSASLSSILEIYSSRGLAYYSRILRYISEFFTQDSFDGFQNKYKLETCCCQILHEYVYGQYESLKRSEQDLSIKLQPSVAASLCVVLCMISYQDELKRTSISAVKSVRQPYLEYLDAGLNP